jgi:hypothetical protein
MPSIADARIDDYTVCNLPPVTGSVGVFQEINSIQIKEIVEPLMPGHQSTQRLMAEATYICRKLAPHRQEEGKDKVLASTYHGFSYSDQSRVIQYRHSSTRSHEGTIHQEQTPANTGTHPTEKSFSIRNLAKCALDAPAIPVARSCQLPMFR